MLYVYDPKSQSQIGRVGYALTDEDGNADEEKTVQIRGQTTDDPVPVPIHHPPRLSVAAASFGQAFYGGWWCIEIKRISWEFIIYNSWGVKAAKGQKVEVFSAELQKIATG